MGGTRLQNIGLGEVHQVYRRLFDTSVVVGRGEVDLHHIFAGHAAGVGDHNVKGDIVAAVGEILNFLGESGVAQAVAEGVLNNAVVVEGHVASLGLGVGRLIEPVAHIDALHIVDEGQRSLEARVKGSVLLQQVVHVVIGEAAIVVVGGGGLLVVDIGLYGAARRIHGPLEDFAQGVHGGASGAGGQQNGTDGIIVVDKAQLHGIVGVDHHDYFIEIGRYQIDHIPLTPGQLEVAFLGSKVIIAFAVVGKGCGIVVIALVAGGAGASAAVDGVGSRPAEDVDLVRAGQGEHPVVLSQHDALVAHLLEHHLRGSGGLGGNGPS